MSLESLRWYQWLMIGAVGGALIGIVRVGVAIVPEDRYIRTLGQDEFEGALLHSAADGSPVLQDMVIHPQDRKGICWITGIYQNQIKLHSDSSDSLSPLVDAQVTTPFKYAALEAYLPLWGFERGSKEFSLLNSDAQRSATPTTIFAFLDNLHQLSALHAPNYQYAWYEPPLIQFSLWTGSSAFLLGVVWPQIVRVLVGAGYGRNIPESDYDLSRFGRWRKKAKAKTQPQFSAEGVTGGEDPKLQLPALEIAPSSPVGVLVAQQVEPSAATASTDEDKEFGGEFYPTTVHVPRHDE